MHPSHMFYNKVIFGFLFFFIAGIVFASETGWEWDIEAGLFEKHVFKTAKDGYIQAEYSILGLNEHEIWSPGIFLGCRSGNDQDDVKLGMFMDKPGGHLNAAVFVSRNRELVKRVDFPLSLPSPTSGKLKITWSRSRVLSLSIGEYKETVAEELKDMSCYLSASSIHVTFKKVSYSK